MTLCVANLSLGITVFNYDRRNPTNRLFLLTVLSVVGWISSISLALSPVSLSATVPLGRLGFAFASSMPFVLLWLFETFRTSARRRVGFRVASFSCLAAIILSLSPWVVAGATPGPTRPNFVYGPLHAFLGLYVVCCLVYALVSLTRIITEATGLRKLQLSYLLVGVMLGGSGIVVTNLAIPLIWKTSRYSIFGPYFTLVFLSFAAHAIIRHRLMNVRLFVQNGVVYFTAIGVSSCLFLLAAASARWLANRADEGLSPTVAVALALVVAILFQPSKQLIHSSLNRYVYRESYNYQRTIREISRQLGSILDQRELLAYLLNAIDRVLRVERQAIYLSSAVGRGYVLRASTEQLQGEDPFPRYIEQTEPFIQRILSARTFLLREQLTPSPTPDERAVLEAFHKTKTEMAIPLVDDTRVVGLVLLGSKRSGDAFFSEDIDLLSTLLSQATIAIKNAHLYREVVLAHEHIENILETMESAVVAVTADQTITLFNSAAGRLVDLDPAEIRNQTVSLLPETLRQPLLETLADATPRSQIEATIEGFTGRLTPAVYSTSLLTDRAGVIFGVVIVLSDLTRVKQLETEKRRTERLASIGAFAAGIAHEIKNPLVAIKTFAELLPERFLDQDFRLEFSKVAIREIARIDELIGRLRGLVTSTSHRSGPLSFQQILDETLSLLRAHIQQSQIKLYMQSPDWTPRVIGDNSQLKQLMLNLLLNAIEAMPQGGELHVSLGKLSRETGTFVVVEIRDTGVGVPEPLLDRIFDPFVTTKVHGSGLGLSICRGIVEAHRGTIRVASAPLGRGTVVSVELPATEEDQPDLIRS